MPRETVGKSSNVKALLATVNMDVQNLPMSENTIITVLNSEKRIKLNNLVFDLLSLTQRCKKNLILKWNKFLTFGN
jgi:hypothetical protein